MTTPVALFDGLSAGEHAATAADAIRAINHLTAGIDDLGAPAEAEALLADLAVMAERLPQTLHQIARHLDTWARDPRTVVDTGEFRNLPVTALHTGSAWLLGHATTAANQLADALAKARYPLTYARLDDDLDLEDSA
jgi:hypothetical protein